MRPLLVVIPPDNPRSHVANFLRPLTELLTGTQWIPQVIHLDAAAGGSVPWPWQRDGILPRGIIWFCARAYDLAMIESLAASGVAVVTYNRDLRFTGASAVVADVAEVTRTQFNWLRSRGKSRFAVLRVDRPSPSLRQYGDVARQLAEECGAVDGFRCVDLPYTATQRPSDEMSHRIDALMAGENRPDAVMCSDIFSFRGLELWLAKNRQVRVPDDVGIATFDPIVHINVQRLRRRIPVAMMDQARMLSAAVRLLDQPPANRAAVPQIERIPAIMDSDAFETTPQAPTALLCDASIPGMLIPAN